MKKNYRFCEPHYKWTRKTGYAAHPPAHNRTGSSPGVRYIPMPASASRGCFRHTAAYFFL